MLRRMDPVPVAFSAVPNRHTGVDPATVFDLNGDLVGDLKVGAAEVMVPLRVVAPALGLGVTFNSTDMTATIGWYEQ